MQHLDIIIIGAGPSGLCAALRLLDLGYRVGLVEQARFPRSQIGESLSPGIRNIFQYLRAAHLLEDEEYLTGLSAQVIWETRQPKFLASHGTGVVVNRANLDKQLLDLAVKRGLHVWQPATIESSQKRGEKWLSKIRHQGMRQEVTSTFILDARGRKGVRLKERFLTSAPSVAIWTHVPVQGMPDATLIEAMEQAWLWASPVAQEQYRIMVFIDPDEMKQSKMSGIFQQLLQQSRLLQLDNDQFKTAEYQTCSVLNYIHTHPWQDNYIRLGEAAFTLDPLSSTGVEKAMRFSLQVAIAIHTFFKTKTSDLAQTFYHEKIIEAVSTHTQWTKNYYATAWPSEEYDFWNKRSHFKLAAANSPFIQQFIQQNNPSAPTSTAARQKNIHIPTVLNQLWWKPLSLSPDLSFSKNICIENDLLQLKATIRHPSLERDIAYLGQHELKPLLDIINGQDTLGTLLQKWSQRMPFEQAAKLGVYLWDMDILNIK